ncbi:MAG TPA: lasso peptide biosynthesis B2 protein [Thermoanaerobaculia bacterium]|nr:lasso peptide biosynthesis B2 protein [Thermoanaerobaculia bacterium]
MAALRLVAVRILVALLGAPRTLRLLSRRPAGGVERTKAELAANAIERAARRLPLRTNCLDQALALAWTLRAAGIASEVRFGVRRDDAALAAHAWVEHDGMRLLGDDGTRFTPLKEPS